MRIFLLLFILSSVIIGCQKPPVSIQNPNENKKEEDKAAQKKQALLDEYIKQNEKQKNIDDESMKPEYDDPQQYLESLTRESRQNLKEQNDESGEMGLVDDPMHSRFNSSTYAKSLDSRFLSLQEETSKSQGYLVKYQNFNDHILTQLLQGISFSKKPTTPNEAIEIYESFYMLNLFPNFDESWWWVNEPLDHIEFFEVAAILAKTSILSNYSVSKVYKDYYLPIKLAYDSYFELDSDYEIEDYLAMAYLTEQYVFYDQSTGITPKTAGDFISLVDNYNCQVNKDLVDTFIDKIICFKTQNYIDSSLALAASLHSPDVNKMKSMNALDFESKNILSVLKQLDKNELWGTELTKRSKLKLSGILVWSNIYKSDNGESVIKNFNDIYNDLLQSKVVGNLVNKKKTSRNKRFELAFPLNDTMYSEIMFNLDEHEPIQAIAIELTRTSMGLY